MQKEWLISEMGFGDAQIILLELTYLTSIVCMIGTFLVLIVFHGSKFLAGNDPEPDDEFIFYFGAGAILSAALAALFLLIPVLYLTLPTSIVILSIIAYGSAVVMNMNININIRNPLDSSVMKLLWKSGTFQSFIVTFVIVLNLLPLVTTFPPIPTTATSYDRVVLLLGNYAESITSINMVSTFLAIHSFLTIFCAAANWCGFSPDKLSD